MEALHSNILYGLMPDAKAQTHLETLPHNPGPDSKWSCSSTGFLLHDDVVYVPNIGGLRTHVLKLCHDHLLAGHPGQTKTLKLVCWDYFWPEMHDDMTAFVKSCITCGRAKACRHQPYGILQQLPIPECLWHSLSMDFIEQLPPSFGYTSILVIVDRLTKQALFLPMTDEVTSEGMAQLYFQNIFLKHSVPTHITSDWGTEFVSHFFCSLSTLLGIRLHFTLGYHPQADGHTECVNQPWNSTSTFTVISNKTTGPVDSLSLSSLTTILKARLLGQLHSLLTRGTTQHSLCIWIIFLPLMQHTNQPPISLMSMHASAKILQSHKSPRSPLRMLCRPLCHCWRLVTGLPVRRIYLDDVSFSEARWQIPRSFWNHRSCRTSILHPSASQWYAPCPSGMACLPARASPWQPLWGVYPTTPTYTFT